MKVCGAVFWWFTERPWQRHEVACQLVPGHVGDHSATIIVGAAPFTWIREEVAK